MNDKKNAVTLKKIYIILIKSLTINLTKHCDITVLERWVQGKAEERDMKYMYIVITKVN